MRPTVLRWIVSLIVILGFGVHVLADDGRQVVSLNKDWRFIEQPVPGAERNGVDVSRWALVSVPHVFPPVGTPDHLGIYHGEAWYRRSLQIPPNWNGKRIYLRFDAVAMVSDVYLDGVHLGQHRGGFSAFVYEITRHVHPGSTSYLTVRVDDRWNNDVAPLEGSLLYGGIYRNVSLIAADDINITLNDEGSSGLFITQHDVSADSAKIDVREEIDSDLPSQQPATIRVSLCDANGRRVDSRSDAIALAAHKVTPTVQSFILAHPHLWNGVDDPYLYWVKVDIICNGRMVDSVAQPLGLRFFRFDKTSGFFLNGKHHSIHGVCLHQDYAALGWAVPPEDEQKDLTILRAMGVDALRLVHYPHSQSALDLYDRTGMIVWSELSQFRLVSSSPAYLQNVRQQLTEMIRQNYNHPSIIMWSLYNELASSVKKEATPIIVDLNQLAHREDPTRPTVGAASGDTIYNCQEIVKTVDLVADNNYAGWYQQAPEDMNSEIEKINAMYGKRGLAISEYGGGAKISDHQQNLVTGQVNPHGDFQPEEWQALVHEGNYRAIRNQPAVWGSFLWLAFDTGGLARADGTILGGNIKGLVTQDRQTCKDAYYLYQANWTTKPMLYLTSRRDVHRRTSITPVKVYSNQRTVMLTINGKSYGSQAPDDLHVFHWQNIALSEGDNAVTVKTPDGLTDSAVWRLTN